MTETSARRDDSQVWAISDFNRVRYTSRPKSPASLVSLSWTISELIDISSSFKQTNRPNSNSSNSDNQGQIQREHVSAPPNLCMAGGSGRVGRNRTRTKLWLFKFLVQYYTFRSLASLSSATQVHCSHPKTIFLIRPSGGGGGSSNSNSSSSTSFALLHDSFLAVH